jgi:hypothetical protein
MRKLSGVCLIMALYLQGFAQFKDLSEIPATVDFSAKIRAWDGFGVNYVETSQTFNYDKWPQDYGGFSFIDQKAKEEIVDLIFGENGLQPDLVKMFYDPLHQTERGGEFNHERTTANMRFVRTRT